MPVSMLELLMAKARAQVETAGRAADNAMNELVRQLKERGIKVRSSDVSTRSTDAEIVIFTSTRFELVIQVADDGKCEVQLWDVQKQDLEGAGFTKSIDKVMKDLKKYAERIKSTKKESTGPKAVVAPATNAKPTKYINGRVAFDDAYAAKLGRGNKAEWVVFLKIDGEPKAISNMGSAKKDDPQSAKSQRAAEKMAAEIKAGDIRLKEVNGQISAIWNDESVTTPVVKATTAVKWPLFNGSAVKMRNWIKKIIGGKPLTKLVPNDGKMTIRHQLTVKQALKLVEMARANPGVKVNKYKFGINTVQIQYSNVNMYVDLLKGIVTIYDNKPS